jgi:thiamine biosynthesis lipoprotein
MPEHSFTFEAIGTRWTIDINEPVTPDDAAELERLVRERIDRFDRHYSRFRPDSLVMEMAARPGRYALPDDAAPMFEHYQDLYRYTAGHVSPLVGDLLVQAGYDADYSLTPGEMTPTARWEEALVYEPGFLTLTRPVVLDFGAAGKGYLVDLIAGVLEGAGVRAFDIDAGGDILHRGPGVLRVGLEHPGDATMAVGVVELPDGYSLCASATNRRAWAGLHHVLDPVTALPADNVMATWVVAASALVADGLATALFFVEPARLVPAFAFDFVVMYTDASVRWSRTLPGEVFAP